MTDVLMPTDSYQQILDDLDPDNETTRTTIETLLARGERSGHKRTQLVAVRIRHDINLLESLLRHHGVEAAARRKVEALRAKLAAAEVELHAAEAGASVNIARFADSNQAPPAATTKTMRAWLLKQGHDVADRGRLTAAQISLYENAHQGGAE
jgi:hypothetical protein